MQKSSRAARPPARHNQNRKAKLGGTGTMTDPPHEHSRNKFYQTRKRKLDVIQKRQDTFKIKQETWQTLRSLNTTNDYLQDTKLKNRTQNHNSLELQTSHQEAHPLCVSITTQSSWLQVRVGNRSTGIFFSSVLPVVSFSKCAVSLIMKTSVKGKSQKPFYSHSEPACCHFLRRARTHNFIHWCRSLDWPPCDNSPALKTHIRKFEQWWRQKSQLCHLEHLRIVLKKLKNLRRKMELKNLILHFFK